MFSVWHCATHAAPATAVPLLPPFSSAYAHAPSSCHCSLYLLSSCRPPLSFGNRSMFPLIDCIGIHFMANYSIVCRSPPPLPLSTMQAPAVRTCLALPLSHSTAEAQPTGQLPLSNFHMQSQLTFCGCHSKWHNLTPPPSSFPPLTIEHSMAKLYPRPPPAVPHPCSFAPV